MRWTASTYKQHVSSQVTSWMHQHPQLTVLTSPEGCSPSCAVLTQANLLWPSPRHRSINLFLLAYQRIWIETEEYSFEEKLVQDLAVSTCVAPPQCPLVGTPCTVRSWASPPWYFPSTFLPLSFTCVIVKSAWKPPNSTTYHWVALSHPCSVFQLDAHF